jgi:hypothetical protein
MLPYLIDVFGEATLPAKLLEGITDNKPVYTTTILDTKLTDTPSKNRYTIFSVNLNKDTTMIADFTYKVGKLYRYQISAGLTYTVPTFIQSKVVESNGQITITNTSQQYRLTAGLNIYLGKGLFLLDDKLSLRPRKRGSLYVGLGIPKPLENIYLGYSNDFVPGLKGTFGWQLFRADKYNILNNQIVEHKVRYQVVFPFVALSIDASSLTKALQIFKK